ncbi:hypothetical protein PENTCL1PPCAC_3995, partial [Pristionchus entomophagus]
IRVLRPFVGRRQAMEAIRTAMKRINLHDRRWGQMENNVVRVLIALGAFISYWAGHGEGTFAFYFTNLVRSLFLFVCVIPSLLFINDVRRHREIWLLAVSTNNGSTEAKMWLQWRIRTAMNMIRSTSRNTLVLPLCCIIVAFGCYWLALSFCRRSLTVIATPFFGIFMQTLARAAGISDELFDYMMDVTRLSAMAWSFPIFFWIVRLPCEDLWRICATYERVAATAMFTPPLSVLRIDLPYNLGSIKLCGEMVDLLSDEGVMTTVAALGVFFSLIGASTAAALIGLEVGIVQPATVKASFQLVTVLTVLWCSPRFFFPALNTINSTFALMAVVPATIATLSYSSVSIHRCRLSPPKLSIPSLVLSTR